MQSFTIAPAGFRFAALLLIIVIPLAAVFGLSLAGARGARFDISPEGLRLRGDFYGRLIPASQIRSDLAKRADFVVTPELQPFRRTMGTGLPGYQAGWFRLQSGEKALLYLTDRQRAVYIPTTAGYSVLLSPADPDAFLLALRSIGKP
jgi:hypothetical protein